MLSTWSGRVTTEKDLDILPVDVVERGSGKGTVTCALLWMRSIILRPSCWVKGGGDAGVCGAGMSVMG